MQQAQDFRDECDALHGVMAGLAEAAFDTPTAFKGWTFNTILRHLHLWNRAAEQSLREPERFAEFVRRMKDYIATGRLTDFEAATLQGLAGRALFETWHDGYRQLAEDFSTMDPALRLQWAGPSMSARSSITARLMETWAHSQAIYDELGIVRRNADRIQNIVVLGINTYEWTFRVRGLDAPQPRPFLQLTAPSGALWSYGEDNAAERIEGAAEAFCQVVTQTRNIADVELRVRGPNATAWMAMAQCFAGGPETPPKPGSRRTRST